MLDIFEERDNLIEMHPLGLETISNRSIWFHVGSFEQLMVGTVLTEIDTPTTGLTIWLEVALDDRDSQPDQSLWRFHHYPYSRRLTQSSLGPDAAADLAKRNLISNITVPPVRAVVSCDRMPARYLRARWLFGATSATFRVFAMGK